MQFSIFFMLGIGISAALAITAWRKNLPTRTLAKNVYPLGKRQQSKR